MTRMPTTISNPASIDPRWVGLGFAVFTLALLTYALVWPAPTPVLLCLLGLVLVAPPLGLLSAAHRGARRILALILFLFTVALALAAIVLSGGAASPLWPVLIMPVFAALLLLPGPPGAGVAAAIWLGYGALILRLPFPPPLEVLATWLMQTAIVGLLALLIERMLTAQRTTRERAALREHALHTFLKVSNELRISTSVQRALEDVASAVQAAGNFDCVTLSLVDWASGDAQVAVAIGASGRRLAAVEGLRFAYTELETRLETGVPAGAVAVEVQTLPFRSLPNERHLVLLLRNQLAEVRGVLSVSAARPSRAVLVEALPLLELLANQAAAAIDNADLFGTLEQRVQQATADLEHAASDLRRARDRAEVLYHIARALSTTLDERQVLEQTLSLTARHIGAERGGIMLVEPNTGRLVFRTTLERQRGGSQGWLERGQGLAGWVLANRQAVIVPDTTREPRWMVRSSYDQQARAVLAVPITLENEALGVLILIHSAVDHFTAEHAQIAGAAAGQAAAALAKAQLYRYVSEQSEHLGVVARQREEEASKLMAMLRSIGDGVVVSDRLGLIRIVNPAAEAILGITAEAFLNRPISELPGAPAGEPTPQVLKFVAGERIVRAHWAAVISSQGDALGSVVVYHDVTREEAADRLKTELVATASHELRTPMTSIRGFVDMLLLGTFGEVTEAQREPLRVIKNNVVRLVQLIDELLDMSRMEAGEVRLRRERVQLDEVLRDVTHVLQGQFREREVSLHLDLHAGLPAIFADRQRLEQIAVNLISNACKYTPRGGAVSVTLRNGGDALRVEVRDNGVGIPYEAQQHIFTPFYRADNPLRDEVGGTGLGLSITRKLVELHGGAIWFESAPNQGSVFCFTLPLNTDDRPPTPDPRHFTADR
jgi:signal transduction histidine kinase